MHVYLPHEREHLLTLHPFTVNLKKLWGEGEREREHMFTINYTKVHHMWRM